jgi:O-antigen/teichoic acid export membrane protein
MSAGRSGGSGAGSSLGRNALYSAAQAVGTAILLFVAYRFLVRNLAPDDFGLWALLISVAGIARLADFGVGAAASRFVALDLGRDACADAVRLVQSLALATAVLSASLAILVEVASPLILAAVVPASALEAARQLLPLMLANLVLTMTGTAVLGGLEGAQRFGLRAAVVILSNVAFVAGCMSLTGRLGLLGVGLAQVLQGVVLAVGAWAAARSVLGFRDWWPRSVSILQLRRVLNFGASFQAIAVLQVATELGFKALLTQRVGLPAAGLFEIAQRVPMLLRAPLVAASQVLLPAVARRPDDRASFERMYARSCRLAGFATLATFGALFLAWPLLTVLLLGHFDRDLYLVAITIAAGWGLNLLAAPAYFSLLGMGSTAWHVASHAVIALGVLALALARVGTGHLGPLVVGYALALVSGSYVVFIGLHRRAPWRMRDCLPAGAAVAAVAALLLAAATSWLVPRSGSWQQWLATGVALAAFAVSLWPSWRRLRPDLPAGLAGLA